MPVLKSQGESFSIIKITAAPIEAMEKTNGKTIGNADMKFPLNFRLLDRNIDTYRRAKPTI